MLCPSTQEQVCCGSAHILCESNIPLSVLTFYKYYEYCCLTPLSACMNKVL